MGVAVGTSLYGLDWCLDKSLSRNARTLYAGIATAVDYKLLSGGPKELEATHRRVAERILWVCRANSGLYIKLGQGIAVMNHVLPDVYTEVLSVLQDRAESVPYSEVEKVIKVQLGRHPKEIFADFPEEPIASASIAQVHKARLKDGREVAVKVLKPHVLRQMPWDLAMYRFTVFCFERLFDLPMYWTVEYTSEHLRRELDFEAEAHNAERAAANLGGRADCFVPTVHWDLTRKQVMTADWISGVKITDVPGLRALGVSQAAATRTLVEVMADQIFCSGFVHCDPHPGNFLVCKGPTGGHRLCILDHGLYIEEPAAFRQQYCQLWEAMFLRDSTRLKQICGEWGIRDSEFFASLQLIRPFSKEPAQSLDAPVTPAEAMAFQVATKERVKHLLAETESVPLELIFVGRAMNLVRFNNKLTGAHVNRIRLFALAATRGAGLGRLWTSYLWFQMQLLLLTISYDCLRLWHRLRSFSSLSDTNAEDTLEAQERSMVRSQLHLQDERRLGLTFRADNLG